MTVIYLIFILLSAYFSFRYDGKDNDSHKNHRFWLLCIMLIMISGFSYGLGGDKFAYMSTFDAMATDLPLTESVYFGVLLQGYMPLWTILTVLIKKYFASFYVIQFVQSTIVNITYCSVIKKYTNKWFMFLLLYFVFEIYFQFNMEVMREGVAIAFSLIATERFFKGHKVQFYGIIAFALLFHISAVVMLIFPFIRIKITNRTLPYALLTSFLVWALSDLVIVRLATMVLGSTGMLVQKFIFYSLQASTIFGYIRNVATYLVLPFVVMFFYLSTKKNDGNFKKFEHVVAFSVFLGVLASSFAGFVRFYNYIQIFYLAMLAEFAYSLFTEKKHLIIKSGTFAGLVFLLMLKYFTYFPANKAYLYQLFVPYTCILDEDRHVFFRNDIHDEATNGEVNDKNTRDIR